MFKKRLAELRRAKGLTQVELAKELKVSNGTIGMWESGKREPNFNTMQNIAEYFGVSVDYLLGREDLTDDRFEGMDAQEILENLATRDEMRVLFSLTKDATREDILRTIKIIEALKEKSDL